MQLIQIYFKSESQLARGVQEISSVKAGTACFVKRHLKANKWLVNSKIWNLLQSIIIALLVRC